MNKRAFLTIPSVVLAVAAFAPAPIVIGHSGTASGTCNGGVTWQFQNYDKTVVNSIVVRVDGQTVHSDLDFKASDQGTVATDKTAPHTWSVVVNAPGTEFDKNLSGSYAACVTVPTTTVAATTTTIAATTSTSPATTTVPPATDPAVTTTTVVEVGIPPVPSTVLLVPPVTIAGEAVEPALPRTGASPGDLATIALICLMVGGLVAFTWRRT